MPGSPMSSTIEHRPVLRHELQPSLAGRRLEHPVAGLAQVQVEQVGDGGIVLDDDHRLVGGHDLMVARSVTVGPTGAGGVGTVPAVATYLDRILRAHRERAAADPRSLPALVRSAEGPPLSARPRGFRRGAAGPASGLGRLAVIAEVKRRSPSKGPLQRRPRPGELARAYEDGGAAALSVLTDAEFFGGSPADLAAARAPARTCPVLRKDFTVAAPDVCDARLMGADCVLLIVAALGQSELSSSCTPWPRHGSGSTCWSRCTTSPSWSGRSPSAPRSSASTSGTS